MSGGEDAAAPAGGTPAVRASCDQHRELHRRKQAQIIELFGTIEFDSKYDYRKQRRKS